MSGRLRAAPTITMAIRISVVALVWLCAVAGMTSRAEAQIYDASAFAPLRWRSIGPFRAGRSVAVAGSVARPKEYYAGTTGGGVFKTISGGLTWFPVSDGYFGGTIGGIAISPSNPDVVYVGTGEYAIRNNVSPGDGVYKTMDGGKTWSFLGLEETRHISRVLVHPTSPDVVYVAAQGHAFGPNPERGIYRSTDGGQQWKELLFLDDSLGAVDLVMDPSDPRILYAAFAYIRRTLRGEFTGKVSGRIFKSTDDGEHWTELTQNPGLPERPIGNLGLSVSPANPKVVWALVEAKEGGLFRSRDAGATWELMNDNRYDVLKRPPYYGRVFADPKNENTVYVLNTHFRRSTDGGKTFSVVMSPGPWHPDHGPSLDYLTDSHQLWIAPEDAKRMIVANDQGMRVSEDGGATWSPVSQATGQIYTLTTTNHFPYQVCGSYQDNDAFCGPSRSDTLFDLSAWYNPGGGEGSWVVARPDRPDVTYASGMIRHDRATGLYQDRPPWVAADLDHPHRDVLYRWHYPGPVHLSPHDPNMLYVGAHVLFRTRDEGESWEVISPDLTNVPASVSQEQMAVALQRASTITTDTGVTHSDLGHYIAALVSVAESPVARGVIWAGSNDGRVSITRDGGKHWENVTPRDLPESATINRIDASRHAASTAYVAATRHLLDDYTPYLYKTVDYGRSWTRIDNGIPRDEFTRVVREDPVRAGLLFAGTERGVWVSFDDGGNWQSLRLNLPIVPIHDLVIKEGDIAVATHGRSFWILDDISPLRELTPGLVARPVHLFQPLNAYRIRWSERNLQQNRHGWGLSQIHTNPVGENPPSGVVMHYWLKRAGASVTLEILDASGRVVRTLTSRAAARSAAASDPRVPNNAGVNRFVWDYLYPPGPSTADPRFETIQAPGFAAPPGRYTVRLRVGTEVQTRSFTLQADPRVPMTEADLQFNVAVDEQVRRGIDVVSALYALRQQLAQRTQQLTEGHAARSAIRALEESVLSIERQLLNPAQPHGAPAQPNRQSLLATLSSLVVEEDAMVTTPHRLRLAKGSAALQSGVKQLRDVLSGALPAVNAALRAASLDEVSLSTVLRPRWPQCQSRERRWK